MQCEGKIKTQGLYGRDRDTIGGQMKSQISTEGIKDGRLAAEAQKASPKTDVNTGAVAALSNTSIQIERIA